VVDSAQVGSSAGQRSADAIATVEVAGSSMGVDERIALERTASRLLGRRRWVRLGRYEILENLGRGACGVVLGAVDPQLGRKVAIKLVLSSRGARDHAQWQARLLREAQALARLRHPNVVEVFDVGEHEAQGRSGVYLVMERLEGETLRRWIDDEQPSWQAVLDAYLQAGEGLAAAHDQGLVHRDFKPDNVMMTSEGRVKVIDFGLARVREDSPEGQSSLESNGSSGSSEVITHAGTVLGTPAYMAPEQHLGRAFDERADQYAYCVALYEGLYGRRPFEGKTLDALYSAKVHSEVGRASSRGARSVLAALRRDVSVGIPRRLLRVIARGLHPDRSRRWPSMSVLLHRLERARRGRWHWMGGAVLFAAAGSASLSSASSAERDRCLDAQGALQVAWNDAERSAIRSALRATALPQAAQRADAVVRALDAHATRWHTAWASACATVTDAPHADERIQCLQRRLNAFAALVSVLREADEEAAQRSIEAIAGLPDSERCLQADGQGVSPPPTEHTEAVEAIRRQIERAHALLEVGRLSDAADEAAAALEAAHHSGHAPTMAAALAVASDVETERGDVERAIELRTDATWTAVGARDDALAARTAVGLVYAHVRNADTAGATTWLRHAEAILDRHPDPEQLAWLERGRGELAGKRGEHERALEHHREAVRMFTDLLGPDHLTTLTALGKQAVALFRLNRAEEAADILLAVTDAKRSLLGADHPATARAMVELGGAYYTMGRYEEARRWVSDALVIHEAALGPDHLDVRINRANLALILGNMGEFDEAIAVNEQTIESEIRARGPDHPFVAVLKNNAASMIAKAGRHEEALLAHRSALESWERALGRNHRDHVPALAGIGFAALELGDTDEALEVFERAQAILGEAGSPVSSTVSFGLARTRWALGDHDDALRHARSALAAIPEGTQDANREEVERWLTEREADR
jgi:eukaryotic-like serine/threonine-protein kinase